MPKMEAHIQEGHPLLNDEVVLRRLFKLVKECRLYEVGWRIFIDLFQESLNVYKWTNWLLRFPFDLEAHRVHDVISAI